MGDRTGSSITSRDEHYVSDIMDEGLLEPNIWKKVYEIRSYETDSQGRLSVLSLCNFLQETAGKHAQHLGVSVQQMLAENYTWVLSRLILKMNSYPEWGEPIAVFTWPSGIQTLFALRDFDIRDRSNRSLGACITAWLVIDVNTRRPVRVESFIDKLKPVKLPHVILDPLSKLPKLQTHDATCRFDIRYRDLDLNQHVNNVSYIEWIVESIPPEVRKRARLSRLEINFLGEAFSGEHVIVKCYSLNKNPLVFQHSILSEEHGQELVRAKTSWR
jgi:acyl-ACP thioesterase